MTMRKFLLLGSACTALMLMTGCVDRATADAKLAKGCAAGVKALMKDDLELKSVNSFDATESPEGPDMRFITIHTTTADGWLDMDRDYSCIFEESFGFLNSSYTASIYQLRVSDDEIYGKSGREIMGDAQDFIKLTDAIRKAMYEE